MAEGAGAQAPPTFKLVLVGDGGTGKVCASPALALATATSDKRAELGGGHIAFRQSQALTSAQNRLPSSNAI